MRNKRRGEHRTLALFLEGEFTLLVIVLVLSSTTILASLLLCALAGVRGVGSGRGDEGVVYLSLILRHIDSFSWSGLVCVSVVGVSCAIERERGWSCEGVVVCNMDCLMHRMLEGLCECVTCAQR